MTTHAFSCIPFGENTSSSDITLAGTLTRQRQRMALNYRLSGDLTQVLLPAPVTPPSRQDDLWQSTCFEFFLGIPQSSRYWEFNLSPTRDWNVYRFDDYRQGMQSETAIADLSWTCEHTANLYQLMFRFDLGTIMAPDQPLQVGITAVISTPDRALSYWALAHPGPEPDFHRRDSFILDM